MDIKKGAHSSECTTLRSQLFLFVPLVPLGFGEDVAMSIEHHRTTTELLLQLLYQMNLYLLELFLLRHWDVDIIIMKV